MGDGLQEEAVKYFKAHQVLFRLVRDFSQKYRSLGHFGGSVSLSSLSDTEQRDLGAFLRRGNKGGFLRFMRLCGGGVFFKPSPRFVSVFYLFDTSVGKTFKISFREIKK